MTRKEVIKELEILKEDYWDDDGYGHETKQYDDTMLALDMAIAALEQEPCEDCVSRKDVENIVNKYIDGSFQWGAMLVEIKRLPSVKPAERVGRWVGIEYDGYADGNPVYDVWECSECKDEHYGDDGTLTPYCPNCGARMEGGNEEE